MTYIPGGFAPTPPGNDHSDDTYSAASAPVLPSELPPGARSEFRVGVLQNGFIESAVAFAAQTGEPAWPVSVQFDPAATAEQFPVLIIPSGGLYGMESNASFRARLEEYARLGGTIVAFAQQHGYEYEALPGGEVGGYGWSEDSSCFAASLYISRWHPILSGFSRATLDAHVDGYFTRMPADAQVLLSRNANGQPGVVLYPYGGGWVFATTIYDDWGVAFGQSSPDARTLLRDLLTWAIDDEQILPPAGGGELEGGLLPQFAPGDLISMTLPLDTAVYTDAAILRVNLISPGRQIAETRDIPLAICNLQSACPFTTTASTLLGIWRVDTVLLTAYGSWLTPETQAARFVIARPADPVAPTRPLLLGITAPNYYFVTGSVAPFTFHVFNTSDVTHTVTIRYGLPHHTWESRDYATYGEFDRLSHTLSVPPYSEATYTWQVTVFTRDRLFAKLIEGGREVGRADFAIFPIPIRASISTAVAPSAWVRGRPVTATLTIVNQTPAAWSGTLAVRVTGADSSLWHTAVMSLELPLAGQAVLSDTFVVPTDASGSVAWLAAQTYDSRGKPVFGARTPLRALPSPLAFSATLPRPMTPGATQNVTVVVTNPSSEIAVADGSLALTVTDPQGVTTPLGGQTFALGPRQVITLSLPFTAPQPRFGRYTFSFAAADEYSARTWQQAAASSVSYYSYCDRASYRAGDTLNLLVPLTNYGYFQESLQVSIEAPDAAYSGTQAALVQPGQRTVLTYTTTLPPDIGAGSHSVTVGVLQPGGDVQQRTLRFVVRPPDLRVAPAQPTADAGDDAALAVTNVGGAVAYAEYDLTLYDWEGAALQRAAGSLSAIGVDESQIITVPVPAEARTGQYWLRGFVRETQTDRRQDVALPIEVAGLRAGLSVSPGQVFYAEGQPVTVVVTVTSTGPAVSGARLTLRATPPVGALMWETYRRDTTPLPYDYVNDLAYEGDLLWIAVSWYGGSDGVAVLDYGGTPFDSSDDRWQVFGIADGLSSSEITHMTIDSQGRKWFGSWGRGVSVLDDGGTPFDKSDDQWATFHVAAEPDMDSIWDVTTDENDLVWLASSLGLQVLDHGGTPFDPSDDVWQTFTTADGLSGDEVRSVVIDSAGRKWLGTYCAYLNVLDDGGTPFDKSDDQWQTFEPDDGLPSLIVWDVVIDDAGRKWLVTEDGVGVLDDGGTPFDKSDDQWQTFTIADGLLSGVIRSIWIDPLGRKWIGSGNGGLDILNDNGTPFDKSDDLLESYTVADGLASYHVRHIIGGSLEQPVWVATQDGLQVVTAAGGLAATAWQTSLPVDLAAGESLTLTVPAGTPTRLGKFRLQARLTIDPDRVLAESYNAFYVFPVSDTGAAPARSHGLATMRQQAAAGPSLALTLDVSSLSACPGQAITLTGVVYNFGATLLEPTLILTQDGQVLEIIGPLSLPSGGQYLFSISTTAPPLAGFSMFEATAADGSGHVAKVQEVVLVAHPAVMAEVQGPGVVGTAPFSVTLILNNVGQVGAQVTVEGIGSPETIFLPAGQSMVVQRTLQTDRDTAYTITLGGDVAESLIYSVSFGENAAAAFEPQASYPAGPVEIPYTLFNTGQLPVQFATAVTIANSSSVVSQTSFDTYLPTGDAASGSLFFDLPAGDYTLAYATPFEAGETAFRVLPPAGVELSAVAGPSTDGIVIVTAAIANTGSEPFDGSLRLETPFFSTEQSVSILPSPETQLVDLPLDLAAAEPGAHTIIVSLLSGSGDTLATYTFPLVVGGPDMTIVHLPDVTPLAAGQVYTLTFGIANRGDLAGPATLRFTFSDVEDEEQTVWLESGEEADLDFRFYLPPGLEARDYLVTYVLSPTSGAERGDFAIPVQGIALAVEAGWDERVYTPGAFATLRITITNLSAAATPDLFTLVQPTCPADSLPTCFPLTGPVVALAGNESVSLDFAFAAEEGIVFYGIYEASEQRGVHLNTTYLYVRNPDVTIVPDRSVYQPGDTVRATIFTTATGVLTVTAPGLDATIELTGGDASFEFSAPESLTRGTYTIDYALDGGETRSAPFDVDAPWVRITEARLLDLPYVPGDEMRADLTVASTDPIEVSVRAWIVAPDGTSSEEMSSIVELDEVLNSHVALALPLDTAQAGPHRLVYLLVDPANPERVYASGSETFDVGRFTVLGVRTERETYPHTTDPVTASVTIYASAPAEADVALLLDGVSIAETTVVLTAGVQTVAVPLPGPIAPAWHDLAAQVTVDGLSGAGQTRFACGADDVDLVAGRVQILGTEPTRTLRAWVYNGGDTDAVTTTVQFWDGAPDEGGTLIDTQSLPALAPGESAWVEAMWDVLGQVGPHTLVAIVDPDDVVAEFYEHNNVATSGVAIPPFELSVETPSTLYNEGDPVDITVRLTNLTGDALTAVVTTTIESESHQAVLTDVHTLYTSGMYADRTITWDTAWAANGAYTIRAVGDGSAPLATGSSIGSNEYIVVVNNVPPAVEAGPDQFAIEGNEVIFNGAFTDPGLSDTHTIWWDFGDGITNNDALTLTHTYAAEGVYTATLTVVDSDGDAGSDTAVVTIGGAPPEVDAGPDQTAIEGQVVHFSSVVTGTSSIDTIVWDFGDGGSASGALTLDHTYADDAPGGVYTVTLTVTDVAGFTGSDSLRVTVENAPPEVEAGADQTVEEGQMVHFGGSFTDPGALDTHTILWNFGDDTTISGPLTPTHTYATDGTYTVALTVTDDDGGVGSDVVRVVVLPRTEFETFEIEQADFHWWGRGEDAGSPSPSASFTIQGRLTLPDGYAPDDFTRDLQLTLVIQGKSVSDTVSLEKYGNVWVFHGRGSPPGLEDGMRITWASLRHEPRSSRVRFTLYGVFSIAGVSRHTRPAEATVSLSLGVAEGHGADQLTGEQTITFRSSQRLWWYRKLWWPWR